MAIGQTVEADISARLDQILLIGPVIAVAGMAQNDPVGLHPHRGIDIQNIIAALHLGIVVAKNRQIGLLCNCAHAVEQLVLKGSHTGLYHAVFHNAGLGIGAGDTVQALVQQQVMDLALIPHGQPGLLLIVETGGSHDVDPGLFSHIPQQVNVAAQVDGGAVDEGIDAILLQLLKLTGGHLHQLVILEELVAEVHAHGPVSAGDVLMHQGLAQLVRSDRAENSIDHHF